MNCHSCVCRNLILKIKIYEEQNSKSHCRKFYNNKLIISNLCKYKLVMVYSICRCKFIAIIIHKMVFT